MCWGEMQERGKVYHGVGANLGEWVVLSQMGFAGVAIGT